MSYLKKYQLLFITVLLCLHLPSLAQDLEDLDDDFAVFWTDVTLDKSLNDKWKVGGDFGFRTALNNNNWKLLYVRPNINYKFSPIFNLTLGIGSFNTFDKEFGNTYEFRIYQDANIRWPKLGRFNFKHRIRLEQRFFNFSNDLDNTFNFRGRYLIGVGLDRFSLGGEKDWAAGLSLEPFFPLGKDVNELLANNFRWDLGLTYHVNDKFRIELDYILQTSEIFSNNDLRVLEHIFRLRFFQSL